MGIHQPFPRGYHTFHTTAHVTTHMLQLLLIYYNGWRDYSYHTQGILSGCRAALRSEHLEDGVALDALLSMYLLEEIPVENVSHVIAYIALYFSLVWHCFATVVHAYVVKNFCVPCLILAFMKIFQPFRFFASSCSAAKVCLKQPSVRKARPIRELM